MSKYPNFIATQYEDTDKYSETGRGLQRELDSQSRQINHFKELYRVFDQSDISTNETNMRG